jgi:hypothetical protein
VLQWGREFSLAERPPSQLQSQQRARKQFASTNCDDYRAGRHAQTALIVTHGVASTYQAASGARHFERTALLARSKISSEWS